MENGTGEPEEVFLNTNGASYGKGDRYTAAPNE